MQHSIFAFVVVVVCRVRAVVAVVVVAVVYLSTVSVYLQAWKRSHSTRLPQFLILITSKNAAILRDFLNCWTWQHQKRSRPARFPQFSKLTTSKKEAILRDFLQRWKIRCRAGGLVPMRFAIFPFHRSKVLRLPRTIILANLKIWCSKM